MYANDILTANLMKIIIESVIRVTIVKFIG